MDAEILHSKVKWKERISEWDQVQRRSQKLGKLIMNPKVKAWRESHFSERFSIFIFSNVLRCFFLHGFSEDVTYLCTPLKILKLCWVYICVCKYIHVCINTCMYVCIYMCIYILLKVLKPTEEPEKAVTWLFSGIRRPGCHSCYFARRWLWTWTHHLFWIPFPH